MILRSFFASVFVVLLVLSVENSVAKLQASSNVSVQKVTPFEPYVSESPLCVQCESCTLIHRKRVPAPPSTTAIQREKNIGLRTTSLSRYPIDTLDPPVI